MASPLMKEEEKDLIKRDIRRCIILSEDGPASSHTSVYCLLRDRSFSLDECATCARCIDISVDPLQQRSTVTCQLSPVPLGAEPAPELSVDAGRGAPVAEIMSKVTLCVRPEGSISEVEELMLERRLGAVPVVDHEGRAVGIVSKTDLLRLKHEHDKRTRAVPLKEDINPGWTFEKQPAAGPIDENKLVVRSIMSPVVLTLNESSTIGQAAALMAFEQIHHLPIVSNEGRVVGILSSLDVLRWLGRQCGYFIPPRTPAILR